MSFNTIIAHGNLTRDPETRAAGSAQVTSFGIATNRGKDKYAEVCFLDCEAWSTEKMKTGELIQQHFTKGKPIIINGRLKMDEWTDKEGNKKTKLKVVVESFDFVGQRQDSAPPSSNSAPSEGLPTFNEPLI